MGFREDYARILEKAANKADLVVRQSALALQTGMVEKTAVDTGRARANWTCGVGTMNTSTDATPDPSGATAIAATTVALEGWKPGQTIYLLNSLPYIRRLEHGWSQQAPQGMVRLTVQDFQADIARKAAAIRNAA